MTLITTSLIFAAGALFTLFLAGVWGSEGLLGKATPAVAAVLLLGGALAIGT